MTDTIASGDSTRTHFGARQTTQRPCLRRAKRSATHNDEKRVMRATIRILLALSALTKLKWLGLAVCGRDLKGVYRHADERVISEYTDQFDGALGSDKLHHLLISVFGNPLRRRG
jgi:hypothetical protein